MNEEIKSILTSFKRGDIGIDEALLALKKEPFTDLGYAKVDIHRQVRQGAIEVIYGASKTAIQIVGIVKAMQERGQKTVLITKLAENIYQEVRQSIPTLVYHPLPKVGIVGEMPAPSGLGKIVIATGGTSDIPVAEEAALTAEVHGNEVVRLYDVGVSGVHRLLSNLDYLMNASVIIAIAGMEGALASVIGGLADCPVIAVPTSIGYGASFGGLSALLSMLNSCASGVSVVNIDNGFGAGYLASMINHMEAKSQ